MMDKLALAFVFVFGIGCGGGEDGGVESDAAMNEPIVNGRPASEFYAQFAHALTMAEVSGAAAFPAQADGRNAFLVAFFLMPQQRLELFYAEGEGDVTPTGHSLAVFGNAKKRRSGTWRVDGASLVLDSYMRCDGFSFNGRDALRCTLSSPIITAAAQGRAGTFQNATGASTPDDSEWADYVQ
jgi:hypothetical protein